MTFWSVLPPYWGMMDRRWGQDGPPFFSMLCKVDAVRDGIYSTKSCYLLITQRKTIWNNEKRNYTTRTYFDPLFF